MNLYEPLALTLVGAWVGRRVFLFGKRMWVRRKLKDLLVRACVVFSASWLIFRVLEVGFPLLP